MIICVVKHVSSADNLIVLSSGDIVYQGSPSNYELAVDISSNPEEGEKKKLVHSQPAEHVAEQEVDEAPIQKSSLGLVPYIFYSKMASIIQVTIVLVCHNPVSLNPD